MKPCLVELVSSRTLCRTTARGVVLFRLRGLEDNPGAYARCANSMPVKGSALDSCPVQVGCFEREVVGRGVAADVAGIEIEAERTWKRRTSFFLIETRDN